MNETKWWNGVCIEFRQHFAKETFPTMNIYKVKIFNIENWKYANVRKLPCTGL